MLLPRMSEAADLLQNDQPLGYALPQVRTRSPSSLAELLLAHAAHRGDVGIWYSKVWGWVNGI